MNLSPLTNIGFIQGRRAADGSPVTLAVSSATPADSAQAAQTITNAFRGDPLWGWALPDLAARGRMLTLFVNGALRYPYVFKTPSYETVAVWIPPGATELPPEDEARLPQLLRALAGDRAPAVDELLHLFEQVHPRSEAHYYLTLFGTHSDHRGRGLGAALLRENLARIDAEGMPAYLESSNPVNDRLYESVGFTAVSAFQAPANGPWVTCMWRKANRTIVS